MQESNSMQIPKYEELIAQKEAQLRTEQLRFREVKDQKD